MPPTISLAVRWVSGVALAALSMPLCAHGQPAAPPPATAPAPAPASQPGAVKAAETPLYAIPDGVRVIDTLASADNLYAALIEQTPERKYRVVINGVAGPLHDWVAGRSLALAPEGGRFAYQTQHDGLSFIVVGQAGGPKWSAAEQAGHYLVGRVLFSPDGKRYAYGVQKDRNGPMSVVLDGAAGPPAEEVYVADMGFSPDNKRFGVRARTGPKQFYIIDGVPQPGYDAVQGLTFSDRGGRFGYRAKAGNQWLHVIDGKETARYPATAGLLFSDDGSKYAYVIESPAPVTAPAGTTRPAAAARQQLVYNDGTGEKAFQPVERIGRVVFSPPDGRRLAITVQQPDKKWVVIVDGKPSAPQEDIGGLIFSPDGKRLASLIGRDRLQVLTVDGKEYPPVDVVATATWSPDGSRLGYATFVGQQRSLMVDDKKLGPVSFFTFSDDGKHVAHALSTGTGAASRYTMAVDGTGAVGVPEYEAFLVGSRMVWESPTTARVIAGRGKGIYLVKVTVGG